MMDWTAGYISDLEYVGGVYREQHPDWLNFVCVLNDIEPVSPDKVFTYFELGFGLGQSLLMFAASHPESQFYGTDFNPAHVVGAKQMASEANVQNVHFLENSFEDLAKGHCEPLPQFDFISLHGIYSWVSKENRDYIVEFISKHLKPGGLVFVSYNALPGWSVSMPLQRLFLECAALNPVRSDLQMAAGVDFATKLEKANARYFQNSVNLTARFDSIKKANTSYLPHEYLNQGWTALYHADVARDLRNAKLSFVGSASAEMRYEELYLDREKQQLLACVGDPIVRETMKDYVLNSVFRKDVFVKGARTLSPAKKKQYLQRLGLVLRVPAGTIDLTKNFDLSFGEVLPNQEMYGAVIDALANGAKSFVELQMQSERLSISIDQVVQIAVLLTVSGNADIFWMQQSASIGPQLSFNQYVAKQLTQGVDFSYLLSPVTRAGLALNFIERLVYSALLNLQGQANQITIPQLVAFQEGVLRSTGRSLKDEGRVIEDTSQLRLVLTRETQRILEEALPTWRNLGLL